LDIKVRIPRELSAFDSQIRGVLQASFSRGSIDLKLERSAQDGATDSSGVRVNLQRAREALQALELLRTDLKLSEPVTLRDISQFPDVIQLGEASSALSLDLWKSELEPLLQTAIRSLISMRQNEGLALAKVLLGGMSEMEAILADIRTRRNQSEHDFKSRTEEKIKRVFEAHPIATSSIQSVLESRITQELALLLDRTDIQEEIDRFQGHIDHFKKTLAQGQQVGRKLEFILQELGREINTLGNKAQDFGISEQVVAVKVRLEQLREQVLNLE
jgi:uncharacterized protein (TIGR00255 family)